MKVIDQKHLTLEYDESQKCIIQVWKGFFSSEQFRNGVKSTNQLFEQKNPARFLVDISTCNHIKKEDTDWAATHAIPLAIKNGLKYYAFVVPTNVFTQMTLNNFKSEVESHITIQPFDNAKSAREWLCSQPD
jgi:hypothetical protein